MSRAVGRVVVALLVASGALGCASLKAPTMHIEDLHVGKPHLTGVPVDIRFRVQNPNPDALRVDKVEYDLVLNGVRLGRGYVAEGFELQGFGQETVASRFELSLLQVPAGVREVLESDRVQARARGKFYVHGAGGRQKLSFDSEAEVSLQK